MHGDVFDGKGVPAREYACLAFDTAVQELTVQAPVAAFNASKRKRGATLGAPPADATEALKYNLLEMTWVPLTQRAPTVGALKRAFSGLLRWVFW